MNTHQPHMKHISRILTSAIVALLLCLPPGITAAEGGHADAAPQVAPAEALARLQAGNQRFVASELLHPHQTAHRRAELANSQHPFAIVLGCADSRTSPEVEATRLRRQCQRLQQDLQRYQALARAAQRAAGLPAPPVSTPKDVKGRRKRKPAVRALRALAALRQAPEAPETTEAVKEPVAPAASGV